MLRGPAGGSATASGKIRGAGVEREVLRVTSG
jgi:hypothetical protein